MIPSLCEAQVGEKNWNLAHRLRQRRLYGEEEKSSRQEVTRRHKNSRLLFPKENILGMIIVREMEERIGGALCRMLVPLAHGFPLMLLSVERGKKYLSFEWI